MIVNIITERFYKSQMEHFYQNIPGWFSYEYMYKEMVECGEDGDLFVEIGSFKGKSSAFMAVEIARSGKKIRFDCIDPFKVMSHYETSAKNDPAEWEGYSLEGFNERLKSVQGYYNPVAMTSEEAVQLYEDGSIDYIMIDGDHTYEGVKRDIELFLPKMKKGGIMTGDDAWAPDVWRAVRDALPGKDVQLIEGKHFYLEI